MPVSSRPRSAALLMLLVAMLGAALLSAPAGAAPVALKKTDVPGAKSAGSSGAALRSALLKAMRGGPRGAVRKAPAAGSAWKIGAVRLQTGSVQLTSESSAKAVQRAARKRTAVGKRTSSATASVRAGTLVGFISVTTKGKDKTVRASADAYARALQAILAGTPATVAERLAGTGDFSTRDALALFQIVYGGMPGAKVPAGTPGSVDDGTIAGLRLYRLLDQLTPAQQAAFATATGGTEAPAASAGRAVRPDAAVRPPTPTATAARAPKKPGKAPVLTPDATWQPSADAYAAVYGQAGYTGHPLPFPIKVFRSSKSIDATADAFPVDAAGKLEQTSPAYCRIRLDPKFYGKPATFKSFVLAHETFHCMEFSITTNWGYKARDWVIEGMADWAASRVTSDPSGFGESTFAGYLFHPTTPLFSLTYAATGFWGQLNERLGNFWPRVVPTLQAGDNVPTFDTAGGNEEPVRVTMASRFVRDASIAGGAWTTAQPFPITDAEAHSPRAVTSAATATVPTPAFAQKIVDVLPNAKLPVVEVSRAGGNVRYTDGSDDWPDATSRTFCLGAACVCPPDEISSLPEPLPAVQSLTAAVTGEKSGSVFTVQRHSLKEYCKKDKDPQKSGDRGDGGSNGDPHLTTLDGLRYDFQAAGEFVLARSGADLEIQARQEPWKIGKTVIRTVTINTQLAMRVGTGRLTISPGTGADDQTPPLVRINGGAPQALTTGQEAAVGNGTVRGNGSSVVVNWPDGSRADVFPVGQWGVAFTLGLADARKGKVSGLLGDYDGSAYDDLKTRSGKAIQWTPIAVDWPGLSRVTVKDQFEDAFADALYDTVGDSWRISQKESLLDYAKGQSTKTFTDQSIPRKLVDPDSLSQSKRAAAEKICRDAGVTAPAALEDCILDVALTGQSAFATAAAKEQSLVSLTDPNWSRLAAGATRYGPVSLARTGDGTLQLVWEDKDASGKRTVVASGLPAGGGENPVVTVAPFDTTPGAFTAPDGTLRMVGAVIDAGPPVTEGIVQFGASAPFSSWAARPMIVSGGAYVGEPIATFAGDAMLTVSGLAGNGKVYRGTGVPTGGGQLLNGAVADDCYAMKPTIASTGSETYAAFWQWDCGQTGLYVTSIDPATGTPGPEIAVPNSTWSSSVGTSAWDSPGLDRLSLAARAGGGVYLAYARQDGDTWSVLLWRIGTPAPMVVASGLTQRPDALQVSAEPSTGVLWVAYESEDASFGKGRLAVRRTTPSGDGWAGDARQIAFPSGGDQRAAPTHPWDVLARDGALDVVAGYPATSDFAGALWRGVVPAG